MSLCVCLSPLILMHATFAVALALLFLANLALSLHLAAAKMPSLPAWLASYHLQASDPDNPGPLPPLCAA